MEYIIAKQNIGAQRVFKTTSRLESALRKAGAEKITIAADKIIVTWPVPDPNANGETIVYPVDKAGNVDHQLAWDMET